MPLGDLTKGFSEKILVKFIKHEKFKNNQYRNYKI